MTLTETISKFEKCKSDYTITEQAIQCGATVVLQIAVPKQNTKLLPCIEMEGKELLQKHLIALDNQIEELRGTIKQMVDEDTTRTVSSTVSPLLTDDELASENPSTLPPSSIIAAVKLKRVRVEGS